MSILLSNTWAPWVCPTSAIPHDDPEYEQYRRIHAFALTVPVFIEDKLVPTDSLTILEYLRERYCGLLSPGNPPSSQGPRKGPLWRFRLGQRHSGSDLRGAGPSRRERHLSGRRQIRRQFRRETEVVEYKVRGRSAEQLDRPRPISLHLPDPRPAAPPRGCGAGVGAAPLSRTGERYQKRGSC